MTVEQLRNWTENLMSMGYGDFTVNVLIEHERVQYEFPSNDFACSPKTKTVIIMSENFNGERNEPRKSD